MRSQISGFTLLELMVTIVVLVVLLGIGVPSYMSFREDRILAGVAQTLYGDISYARSEAIKRHSDEMFIVFFTDDGTDWCYRISDNPECTACDAACDIDGDGTTRGADVSQFSGIQLPDVPYAEGKIRFSSRRGLTSEGDVIFEFGTSGKRLAVHTSALGRASICAPTGSLYTGVQACN